MKERIREVDEDDTSGQEICQSDYYSHLDILIERTNVISAPLERQVKQAQQQAAKQRTRENLHRHLGQKRRADEVLDEEGSGLTLSVSSEVVGYEGGSEEGSTSSA